MRVLVAMSGGVDSSVAAALLLARGHDVAGCTLRLWGGPSDSGCCSVADVEDARRVAQVLGIDHHVFNLEDRFERDVVDNYVDSHRRGLTPNPCVECNRSLKFGALLERARRLGFDALATGHHARIEAGPRGHELRRGADRAKDQSYVLGILSERELASTQLPIGGLTKSDVRALAGTLGLRTAGKPDSQDVCFIPRARRASFLEERLTVTAATVRDVDGGAELGSVPAAELVTVGQRRGIGGVDGVARYVVDVDLPARTVFVADRDASRIDRVALDPASVQWTPHARDDRVLVQLSAHGAPLPARWSAATASVQLECRSRPVAPGQLAVFYAPDDPDLVVGSGTVARCRAR